MDFIKYIARKILSNEIENLKLKAKRFESRNLELREELTKCQNEYTDILSGKSRLQKRIQDIEKENEILRKYYDLDKEPSEEIKTKIHIDLEVNRLKEEKVALLATAIQNLCVPRSYPLYYGDWSHRVF